MTPAPTPIDLPLEELNARLRAEREKAIARIVAIAWSGAEREQIAFIVDGLVMAVIMRDVGHLGRGLTDPELARGLADLKAAGVLGAPRAG